MVIGIDASRAFITARTGTENYSYYLITHMLRLPEAKDHLFVLFTRPNAILPKELAGYTNVIVKEVKWPYLWTQAGLAWETWRNQVFQYSSNTEKSMLYVLWIPAHTLPVLRNPYVKTVVTIHGLEYQWLPEYKNILQKWYLPLSTYYAARSADKIIAVSQFTAQELQKETHIDKKKIKVIHEGATFSSNPIIRFSSNTLDKYGLKSKKYILFVGSIQPRKNLVALIQAFEQVSRQEGELRLVIAGGVGWMASEVLAAPVKYGIPDKVVFTGRVDDLALQQLYDQALLCVQPSFTEGFGLPVLEAMSHGVPVISSDGGALGEVVGEAGIIVALSSQTPNALTKGNFVDRLAGAMKRVIGDKKLQNNLISMGYKRVKEYSWDKAAKATLAGIVG